jgi:NAD(P)-dependent dehydrogenase (short-subunit alcohol dehydrogenase family)
MGRLADKNILVTGGNSGIGLAAAQEFDREGARVAICGLNERSLQTAKETLGAGSLAVRAGRPLVRARGGRQPRRSRPARPRSSISLESSAPNSWIAGFA